MNDYNGLTHLNGFYDSVFDWIKEFNLGSKFSSPNIKVININETIHLPKPKWDEYGPLRYKIRDPYVAIIENGRIWGEKSFVITPNNKVLRDVMLPIRDIPSNEQLPPISHYYPETVATVGWWPEEDNVCLWFLEMLPRIYLLEKSGIPIDKYVFGKLRHSYHHESLQKIGIPATKIIQVDNKKSHIKAKKLVITSIPRKLAGVPPKWTCEFVRNNILKRSDKKVLKEYERIYISREDKNTRTVINQGEVMNILDKYGFKKIVLAPLSLEKKINIFNSAKYIVAPHGAGLVHIAFCNPGTKILEFSPKTYRNPVFGIMSHHTNLDYYRLICDIEKPPRQHPGYDNIIVDTQDFQKILDLWKIQ
ncbi:glycosyltransferase family 61 protein [Cytobacillus firmus]|uniref:glycosyltransferase family 61 protein n=1 Tax=Cytobacillus firmus TaxID=1399 RepID=UPI0024946313|nr:glycosyltransferase family 61 protein [Cytobacillus firmus]